MSVTGWTEKSCISVASLALDDMDKAALLEA